VRQGIDERLCRDSNTHHASAMPTSLNIQAALDAIGTERFDYVSRPKPRRLIAGGTPLAARRER
jgi:hypothetical protein